MIDNIFTNTDFGWVAARRFAELCELSPDLATPETVAGIARQKGFLCLTSAELTDPDRRENLKQRMRLTEQGSYEFDKRLFVADDPHLGFCAEYIYFTPDVPDDCKQLAKDMSMLIATHYRHIYAGFNPVPGHPSMIEIKLERLSVRLQRRNYMPGEAINSLRISPLEFAALTLNTILDEEDGLNK